MGSPEETPEGLVALAGLLVAEQTLETTLSQVIDLACQAIAGGDMGGVTLLDRQGPITAAATDEEARRVDAFQYQVGAGPCLHAYRQQVVNRIDSTVDDQRWPEFSAAAAAAGILSTLSLPLVVAGDGLGALNLYCRHRNGFCDADEAPGLAFATYASVALANARVYWRTQTLATQLEEALSTRGVIEQAKGILIAERGWSDDEAFQVLVRASQRTHTKLHAVAADLVGRARSRATGNLPGS
ncbi:MAG: GAF and ANTAR domain-containing protein [Pseudonocardiaceae bacterium]